MTIEEHVRHMNDEHEITPAGKDVSDTVGGAAASAVTIFVGAKGGSGTTVVASMVAASQLQRGARVLLIDAGGGDCAPVLGAPEPEPGRITALRENLDLVVAPDRSDLRSIIEEHDGNYQFVIVDGGLIESMGNDEHYWNTVLVVRPCYLAVRRAAALGVRASRVVLISDETRTLSAADVTEILGTPVAVQIPNDPSIARLVDAGMLMHRSSLSRAQLRLILHG